MNQYNDNDKPESLSLASEPAVEYGSDFHCMDNPVATRFELQQNCYTLSESQSMLERRIMQHYAANGSVH